MAHRGSDRHPRFPGRPHGATAVRSGVIAHRSRHCRPSDRYLGRRPLIAYYLDRWQAESGRQVDREEFAWLYDLAAVQRCLKATGTFASMLVVHNRPQYLPYIPPTLAYLRPLMQRHGRLRPLADLLRRFTPL